MPPGRNESYVIQKLLIEQWFTVESFVMRSSDISSHYLIIYDSQSFIIFSQNNTDLRPNDVKTNYISIIAGPVGGITWGMFILIFLGLSTHLKSKNNNNR